MRFDLKKTIAFFDFDGTISKSDSFIGFVKYYFGLYKTLWGFIYLFPIFLFYKLRIITNDKAKVGALKHFFNNTNEKAFKQKADDYSSIHLDKILRDKAVKKLNWHQENKHEIVIVSASIDYWLRKYCEKNNFNLIATKLEIIDDKVTGRLLGKNCYGIEKVRRIKEVYNLEDYQEIYAYGDTPGDIPMLNLADKNKAFYRCF